MMGRSASYAPAAGLVLAVLEWLDRLKHVLEIPDKCNEAALTRMTLTLLP